MHTRVVVKCFFRGDLFIREAVDRGARFRDETHIAEVTGSIKAELTRRWAAYVDRLGELQFRVDTREV